MQEVWLFVVVQSSSGLDPSPKALFKGHFMHFYSSNSSLKMFIYYWPHKCVSEKTHEEANRKYMSFGLIIF